MSALTAEVAANLPDGGDAISDADFARLSALANRLAGLTIPPSKRTMVQSRIARRLRTLGRRDISQYIDFVSGPDAGDEREAFVSVMTTNVSSFLRERHHFDTLEKDVLPQLLAAAATGKRVRLWSAGCSSGQEAFTMAISILRLDPRAADKDIQILATDIDHAILARARQASYEARELDVFAPNVRAAFFEKSGNRFCAGQTLRRLVSFRHLNLNASWPMRGVFDVIFCRNVVIYFDTPTQEALWPRFHAQLAPEGWLFLGHSERMANPAVFGFAPNGVTTYRSLPAAGKG